MLIIASDHGGRELKDAIKNFLTDRGLPVNDIGTMNNDSVDYPDFGEKVGRAIAGGEASQGILVCGTGIGMSIVANKFPGVRAALIHDEYSAMMSKEHNNANVLVMGGRVLSPEKACRLVNIWLETPFEGGRHQRRLDKISRIEEEIRSGRL